MLCGLLSRNTTPLYLRSAISLSSRAVEIYTNREKRNDMANKTELKARRESPLRTPSDISPDAVRDITGALNALLADVFALYLKTKNFHWHMSGPHFRDYHLLLDEQGDQIFAIA